MSRVVEGEEKYPGRGLGTVVGGILGLGSWTTVLGAHRRIRDEVELGVVRNGR